MVYYGAYFLFGLGLIGVMVLAVFLYALNQRARELTSKKSNQ